jgi:hypothetical protein
MSPGMENRARRETPKPHVRPARPGDCCVLLEPTQAEELDRLRQRQLALQATFGGTPIERVHLTCQRFAYRDEQRLQAFQERLSNVLAGVRPLSLTALSLQTLPATVRRTSLLKWRVEVTQDVRWLVALVEGCLVDVGIEPLYTSGFVASLVSALKGVPELEAEQLAGYGGFPVHLFTGQQIELSRICGSNTFETLAIIPVLM